MRWILNGPALAIFANDPFTRDFLAGSAPFVIGRNGDPTVVPATWEAAAVRTFTSVAHMRRALANGSLATGVRALLYDCEAWQFTPEVEQRDVAGSTRAAAELAHAHGLTFIAAPAVDLTRALAPPPERRYDAYLRLELAANSARDADVFVIQAQGSERNVERYASFVRAAAGQARAANPAVCVLAGISTNPSGQRVTADTIVSAIDATRSIVDGYWFNVPQPGPYCPKCNDFRPDIALEVFRRLGAAAR